MRRDTLFVCYPHPPRSFPRVLRRSVARCIGRTDLRRWDRLVDVGGRLKQDRPFEAAIAAWRLHGGSGP